MKRWFLFLGPDAPYSSLLHAAAAISLEEQNADAGDEGLAQTEAGPVQETAILPSGM